MSIQHDLVLEDEVKFLTTNIVSENQMYKPNYHSRTLYKNPSVGAFQDNFVDMLTSRDSPLLRARHEVGPKIKDVERIDVELEFHLKPSRKFYELDTTNMVKATEDALVRVTGVDDAYHISVRSEKFIGSPEYERIVVRYKVKFKGN